MFASVLKLFLRQIVQSSTAPKRARVQSATNDSTGRPSRKASISEIIEVCCISPLHFKHVLKFLQVFESSEEEVAKGRPAKRARTRQLPSKTGSTRCVHYLLRFHEVRMRSSSTHFFLLLFLCSREAPHYRTKLTRSRVVSFASAFPSRHIFLCSTSSLISLLSSFSRPPCSLVLRGSSPAPSVFFVGPLLSLLAFLIL